MQNIVKIWVAILLLLTSCNKTDNTNKQDEKRHAQFSMTLGRAASSDVNSINNDNKINSLAIFIFDEFNKLEKIDMIEAIEARNRYKTAIETTTGSKNLYIIANYKNHTFNDISNQDINIADITTKEQLEQIEVYNEDGLTPNNLIMTATKEVYIDETEPNFEISLRRTATRIDIHIFKGERFTLSCNDLKVTKLTINNLVLNCLLPFTDQHSSMPDVAMYYNHEINPNKTIESYDENSVIDPSSAIASLYSYPNFNQSLSPSSMNIEIELSDGMQTYNYKGYIADENQTTIDYSLLSNNIYQIVAKLTDNYFIELSIQLKSWVYADQEELLLE